MHLGNDDIARLPQVSEAIFGMFQHFCDYCFGYNCCSIRVVSAWVSFDDDDDDDDNVVVVIHDLSYNHHHAL
jgi:hypothetical protein